MTVNPLTFLRWRATDFGRLVLDSAAFDEGASVTWANGINLNLRGGLAMKRVGLMVVAIVGVTVVAFGFTSNARAAGSTKSRLPGREQVYQRDQHGRGDQVLRSRKISISTTSFRRCNIPARRRCTATSTTSSIMPRTSKAILSSWTVVSDGKLGVANSIQHFTWKGKDDKPMEATIRVTDVYHKVGGDGKFSIHTSRCPSIRKPVRGR